METQKELKNSKPKPPLLKYSVRPYILIKPPPSMTTVAVRPVNRIPILSRMIPEMIRKPSTFSMYSDPEKNP
jgi:hypothetical protein